VTKEAQDTPLIRRQSALLFDRFVVMACWSMTAKPDESPGCLVERAVKDVLDEAVFEAERLMTARPAAISVSELAGDFAQLKKALLSRTKDQRDVA
jgi:hypothetical protein